MRTSIITPRLDLRPVSFAGHRLTHRKVGRKSNVRYCWPDSFVPVVAESAAPTGGKCGCNDSIPTVRKTTAPSSRWTPPHRKTNTLKNLKGNQKIKGRKVSFIAGRPFIVLQLGIAVIIVKWDGDRKKERKRQWDWETEGRETQQRERERERERVKKKVNKYNSQHGSWWSLTFSMLTLHHSSSLVVLFYCLLFV